MFVSSSGRWIWYRSIQSVCSRRRLLSTSLTIQRRELPNSFGSSPIGPWTLVASTTLSRLPFSALPTISSDSPREYTSAVSMKLIPASSAAWMIRMLSSWSGLPHAPNIIAPRQSGETLTPVRPSGRCSTARSLAAGELDVRRDRGREVLEQLDLMAVPVARLRVDHAQRPEHLAARLAQGDPRVGDDAHLLDSEVVAQQVVLARVLDDEAITRGHGVLAERVRQRRLARGRPWLGQADGALEDLPVGVDQRDERDRGVEDLRGEPGVAVEGGIRAAGVEQSGGLERGEPLVVRDRRRHGVECGAPAAVAVLRGHRGRVTECRLHLRIPAAAHRVGRAHDARVADELRGAHALALGLALDQGPERFREAVGGGSHRHEPSVPAIADPKPGGYPYLASRSSRYRNRHLPGYFVRNENKPAYLRHHRRGHHDARGHRRARRSELSCPLRLPHGPLPAGGAHRAGPAQAELHGRRRAGAAPPGLRPREPRGLDLRRHDHPRALHRSPRRGLEPLLQAVDERRLRLHQLLARPREWEPLRPVDLRELLPAPRARRPLHAEGVRAHGARIEVALNRPRGHHLAVALTRLAQRNELADVLEHGAQLLLELAQGARHRLLALVVLALGDRPRPVVAARPERAARVHEQDLPALRP